MSNDTKILTELNEAFAEFKTKNDKRITEIEKRAGRAEAFGHYDGKAHTNGYDSKDVDELRAVFEGKSMNSLSGSDGGYLVPEAIRDTIESLVLKQSPVRQLANVINIDTPHTRIPVNLRGATGGWVGEGDARTQTSTPQLAEVSLPGGTIYALPKVSEELMEDAITNLDLFLAENVVDTLAENESIAFLNGDGVKKPKGFLSGPAPVATNDDARDFGTLQYVATGATGTLGSDITGTLTKLVFSLRAGYRQADGCAWMMSTEVLSQIASLKDSTGRPLYLPSLQEGVPGRLLGYNVVECEHMGGIAAGNFPIAFGNWRRGYTIADRTDLNVLRDPYSEKGQISLYFRRRVHGALTNSNAIKLLKVAAS